ncbi:hypothetical protein [Compostimonas suwonensis]|uniref:Uncharacterized protein n=1 Tax=Compostimonas suwonensis TaxID=1048394 RepID=A0A2M9C4G6_9MICO|nr:hypothetical protein [Compostimonas suwonensis]PJJ65402.1 hypothetical protein CLV54_0435 [Compostimonas suwonensis]
MRALGTRRRARCGVARGSVAALLAVVVGSALAACSGAPMIALLDEPQEERDILPVHQTADLSPFFAEGESIPQDWTVGLDMTSTRFLAEVEGTEYFVGLSRYGGTESICLIAAFDAGVGEQDWSSACGGVRGGPLGLSVAEQNASLVSDAYDVTPLKRLGWVELHPNLWLDTSRGAPVTPVIELETAPAARPEAGG